LNPFLFNFIFDLGEEVDGSVIKLL